MRATTFRQLLIDNPAVPHMNRAVGVCRGLRIVRDHEDGLAETLIQIAQYTQHGFGVLRVEIPGGFIGQTILMITHNPEAAAYAHRTVHMRDGRIID